MNEQGESNRYYDGIERQKEAQRQVARDLLSEIFGEHARIQEGEETNERLLALGEAFMNVGLKDIYYEQNA